MKQIRVAWFFGLHEDDSGNHPMDGGEWFPDTHENRSELRIIVEEGCNVAGTLTHWIETRDSETPSD